MTINKRFTVNDKWIKDNCIGALLNIDFNTITDANLCCDLLNQIEKEKRNNGKLASKLLKENEELKKEYMKLRDRHSLLHDECLDAECDKDRYYKDVLSLEEENKKLKAVLWAERTTTAETINEYSKQFKRHSKEFSFMVDLAIDLGVDVKSLEAKDD